MSLFFDDLLDGSRVLVEQVMPAEPLLLMGAIGAFALAHVYNIHGADLKRCFDPAWQDRLDKVVRREAALNHITPEEAWCQLEKQKYTCRRTGQAIRLDAGREPRLMMRTVPNTWLESWGLNAPPTKSLFWMNSVR